jgi:predicted Zn-dependent protease
MRRGLLILGIILAGVTVIILILSRRDPRTGEVHTAMSANDEVNLGVHLAPRMSEVLGGLDLGADAQGMLTAAGQRVVGAADGGRSPYRFQFHVLADTSVAEAYALPGGPIFLTRGLLDRLENEAQLAGVIAHQVAHVLARHAAKRFTRGDTTAAAVAKVLDLQYDEAEEADADTVSVRLLGDAGYDPRALIELMRIAEEAAASGGVRGFSIRHPGAPDRKRLLSEAIERAYPGGVPSTLTLGRWFAPEPPEPTDPADSLDPADSAAVLD